MQTPLEIPYDGPEAELIFSRSLSRWQAALHRANSTRQIPESSFNLERTLSRTPSLPETIPSDATWIEGYSTWINSDTSCRLTKTEKARRFLLRKRHPIICRISSSRNFLVWEDTPNNGIALLVLGWAYILTANLVERQNLGIGMEYSSLLNKPSAGQHPTGKEIYLDYALPARTCLVESDRHSGYEVGWSIAGMQVSP
jgi:hypothetical protein